MLVALTAGAYLPSPLYPAYRAAFVISDLAMTLIHATFALVSAPALLLFGSASDALGPRSVFTGRVQTGQDAVPHLTGASGPCR